jgi:thioredoxin-like negative regulator of GroEL
MAGENSAAIPMLGNYLTRVPASTSSVVLPLLNLLEPSELVEILPESPYLRAKLARQFFGNPTQVQFAELLIQGLELDAVTDEVKQLGGTIRREQPWLTVAWLAERAGDSSAEIAALRNAVSSEPLNDKIVFQLAIVLEKAGKREEALEQAERAYSQAKSNPVYKEFVERLREK